jgi:flagellar biosynthesis/type III secretory pathway protein FliH
MSYYHNAAQKFARPCVLQSPDCKYDTRSRPAPAPVYSASLTAIEIALRKEEIPSENVQWAIEKLNQYQENQEHHDAAIAAQAREKVLKELYEYACNNPHGQGFASGVDEFRKLRSTKEQP